MGWKEPGLGWKLFAGLSIALFVGGLFVDGPKPTVLPWLDEVTLPIEVLVLLGLVSYAFNLRIGAPRAWRYLAAFYAAWGALLVIVGVVRTRNIFTESTAKMSGAATGVLLTIAFVYFTWRAIRRLSLRPQNKTQNADMPQVGGR